MKPERDPWTKLLDAWRKETRAYHSLECDESVPSVPSVPLGFSTRVVARWHAQEQTGSSMSWLELWQKCAIPGACAAVLGLVATVALGSAGQDHNDHHKGSAAAGLFVIPDIELPGLAD